LKNVSTKHNKYVGWPCNCTAHVYVVVYHCDSGRSFWIAPSFSGVRVTQSLVLCVCFVDVVYPFVLFSSPCQRQCELLPSLGVHRPLTFRILIFCPKSLGHMNWNLVESIYGRSSLKIAHFVPIY
jgi:hypothetical protein